MLIAVQPLSDLLLANFSQRISDLADRGAQAVELRLDTAPTNAEQLLPQLSESCLPLIATARRGAEGGLWEGHEEERLDLLRRFAAAQNVRVDLEHDNPLVNELEGDLIVSYHNFEETNLKRIEAILNAIPANVSTKIATLARNLSDNFIMRDLLKRHDKRQLSAFCMGPRGIISRIMALWWGSGSSYAMAPDSEQPLAPGMLDLDQMVRVYGVTREMTPNAVYGVVGSSATHSLSPYLHGQTMRDALYLPFETDNFDDALHCADALNVRGLSITTPFKEQAFEAAVQHSESATRSKATNTLKRIEQGWLADNTDIQGFGNDLVGFVDTQKLLQSRVLILGSGGAARAVLSALEGKCGELVLHARNTQRGKLLAMSFQAAFHPDPASDDFGFDLVINATSAGMQGHPSAKERPIDLETLELSKDACVYDLVYTPAMSPLLTQATKLGLRTRNGLGMLMEQAKLQQATWEHDSDFNHTVMRKALEDLLCSKPVRPAQKIALIGYRGAGKSTTGQVVATKLDLPFVDLDTVIEQQQSCPLATLFEEQGEDAFRDHEYNALCSLKAEPHLLACGGGLVEKAETRQRLRQNYTCIWLDLPKELLLKRLANNPGRPNLEELSLEEELNLRFDRRNPFYHSLADFIVEVREGHSVEDIAVTIAEMIARKH